MLEAELAVGGLAAALAALFNGLFTFEFEDGDDVALVDVAAGEATAVDAVRIRLGQHHSAAARALGWRCDGHLQNSLPLACRAAQMRRGVGLFGCTNHL